MDPKQFDDLVRAVAGRPSRRGLLAGVAAGVLGALGLRGESGAQVTQASCGNVVCRNNPGKCKPGCVCCVASNGNSRCVPPGQCSWGQTVCPPERPRLDPVRGCVGCSSAAECPAPGGVCGVSTCTGGVCGVAPVAGGTACRAASCAAGVETQAATCAGTSCPAAVTRACAPYVCAGTACATGCVDDGGCVDGFHCEGVTCVADVAAGQACDEASDCVSGFCVDGICCDSACTGACETCTGATRGTCSAVFCPNGDGSACATTTGVCNPANGNCEVVATNLAQGTSCEGDTALPCISYICDGAGACVEGENRCDPNCLSCDPNTGACTVVASSIYPAELRVMCGGGRGICAGDGACYFPCGEACAEDCYEGFASGAMPTGFFCCADHLDGDGNCCWQFDRFGIVDEQGVCQPSYNPCCNSGDPCCPPGSDCTCSFGRISRCC